MKHIDKLGVVLFLIGGASMDSPSIVVPVIMALAGLAMMGWGYLHGV